MLLVTDVGLSPGDFVLDGDPLPLSKRGRSPQIFSPCLLSPNGWMDEDGTWHGGRPCPVHIVLDGHSSSPQKRGTAPQFSSHLYCGQTAGCIKVPLGMEVGLSLGDCVRWRPSPLPPTGAEPHPVFGPRVLWPNGCMDQDATWYGGRPRPTRHCVRCGPSYSQKKGHTHPTQCLAHVCCGQMAGWMKTPLGTEVDLGPGHIVLDGVPAPAKGAQQPPYFRPMSIVATVAHLSYH